MEFTYESWRHGGWYVQDVRYPSGAVGCVSRNYPDRKWRIVCGDHDTTYPSRDAAAAAEMALAEAEFKAIRANVCYSLYRDISRQLDNELLRFVATYALTDVVLRVAARDEQAERISVQSLDGFATPVASPARHPSGLAERENSLYSGVNACR